MTGCPNQRDLNVSERIISASVGAICTSLLVTPLDVVKTRLQAQAREFVGEPHSAAACTRCTHYHFHNGIADIMLPKKFSHFDSTIHLNSTWDAILKIGRNEGIKSLYNGLKPSLIMSIPSTVLYFATYDSLRDRLLEQNAGNIVAPTFAGSLSRAFAATVVSPLELIRTKSQAMNNPPSMGSMFINQVRNSGVRSLWQGLSPTLFRDIPFSGIYWVCVEQSRTFLISLCIKPDADYCASVGGFIPFSISFLSGAFAGLIAAAITQPFDVVKTRRQISDFTTDPKLQETSMLRISKRIYRNEGAKGFFVGLIPRLGKIAPACAIMLSSYEAGKSFFLTH